MAADRYLVLIAFHHIIGDGISGPLFLKKLERAYLDIGQDHAPLPLADFTATDQTTYDTAEINAFWRQHLTNAYALNPLTPSIKTDQQQLLQQTIDHTIWQNIRVFLMGFSNCNSPIIFLMSALKAYTSNLISICISGLCLNLYHIYLLFLL